MSGRGGREVTEVTSVTRPGNDLANEHPGHDRSPSWVVPFWMLLALAVVFLAGCASGAVLMWFSMLGPLGPGHGPGD